MYIHDMMFYSLICFILMYKVVIFLIKMLEFYPQKVFILLWKQVVQECKEIYENSLVDGNPSKAGFVFPRVKCLAASKGSLWRKLT